MSGENIAGLVLAILLGLYLVAALLFPEWVAKPHERAQGFGVTAGEVAAGHGHVVGRRVRGIPLGRQADPPLAERRDRLGRARELPRTRTSTDRGPRR